MDYQQARAKKGGELGVNGEWYEGGKFLPSEKKWVKQYKGNRKSEKMEIDYDRQNKKWVTELPPENHQSLLSLIFPFIDGAIFTKTGEIKVDEKFAELDGYYGIVDKYRGIDKSGNLGWHSQIRWGHDHIESAVLHFYIRRFNAGQRWIRK